MRLHREKGLENEHFIQKRTLLAGIDVEEAEYVKLGAGYKFLEDVDVEEAANEAELS